MGQWLAPPFSEGGWGAYTSRGFGKYEVGFGRGTACRARNYQKLINTTGKKLHSFMNVSFEIIRKIY